MAEIEDKSALSSFIKKKRKTSPVYPTRTIAVDEKLPWYKRPLERDEFIFKLAKNGKYYIKHKEWGKKIWIGPYDSLLSVENIITSYLLESLKGQIDKKVDSNVHSVVIQNEDEFF